MYIQKEIMQVIKVFLSLFYLYNEEIYLEKVNKQLFEEYDVLFFQTDILFLTVSKEGTLSKAS
ncbi:hypothetical protein [Bacillus sp. 103mf]|uniref:hypothetical protein n=2 Tax=unclassified Bacillus (in: firmicutes) TaxID=185979 RepID=UPI000A700C2F|nr:hypothetical protein [Bacillus sp. 103mf]